MELSLKIVSVDSYLAKPVQGYDPIYSQFTSTGISQVPVLRVFGITPSGAKGCLHVHGVFPYLYVPVPADEENVDGFKHYLAKHLNEAINSTMDSNRSSEGQHIYQITVVRGIPFYGFHSQSQDYYKILLFRPYLIKKCALLLQNGVGGRTFQPHEAHVPFTQQFFIDFNLYGMSPIHLSGYKVRQGSSQGLPKATRCDFEADVLADDIQNNTVTSESSSVQNPGLAYIWEDERIRRREEGQTSQISFAHYDNVGVQVRGKTEDELLEKMKAVLKERVRQGRSLSTDTQSSSNGSQQAALDKTYPLLDTQDMDLLEGFANEWATDDEEAQAISDGLRPEDDSILGSQKPQDFHETDSESDGDPNMDLTVPFVISDSDSNDEAVENDPVETTIRYSSDSSSSDDSDIICLDGNIDDTSESSTGQRTPSKPKRKKPLTPNRYKPLGIKIEKSPHRSVTASRLSGSFNQTGDSEASVDVSGFDKLREMASSFLDASVAVHLSSKELDSSKDEPAGSGVARTEESPVPTKRLLSQNSPLRLAKHSRKALKFDDDVERVLPVCKHDEFGTSSLCHIRRQDFPKWNQEPPDSGRYEPNEPGLSLEKSRNETYFTREPEIPGSQHGDGSVPHSKLKIACSDKAVASEVNTNNIATIDEASMEVESAANNYEVDLLATVTHLPGELQGKVAPGVSKSSSSIVLDCPTTTVEPSHSAPLGARSGFDVPGCSAVLSADSCSGACKPFTLSCDPPNPSDVLKNLDALNLRALPFKQPIYGCPQDLPTTKEIGFTRVSVRSQFARDLEEHKFSLGPSMDAVQRAMHASIFSSGATAVPSTSHESVLHALSSNRLVILTPLSSPPSRSIAEEWLKNSKKTKAALEEESIKRPEESKPDDESVLTNFGMSSQSSIIFNSQISSDSQLSSVPEALKQTITQESSSGSKLSPLVNQRRSSCLIDEATANNSGAFKMEFQNLQEVNKSNTFTYLTVFVMELHVNTRSTLRPNPEYDAVEAIFYAVTNDAPSDSGLCPFLTGMVMLKAAADRIILSDSTCCVDLVSNESELFKRFISIVHRHDPDILVGYEIEMASWGYLIQRGYIVGINMCHELSRLLENSSFRPDSDVNMRDFDIKVSGRIILNAWRMMRHEVPLMSYSFENIVYHILHSRVPHYSHQTLTLWWNHLSSKKRILTVKYYITRVRGIVKLLDSLNLIGRTSEMASLFGIQFYEVLSRGSQFRVESMMLRLAKKTRYVAVSPSIQQRAEMRAPACLPLIMEPESRFYSDPVIVLDFQSLYPSMMIAYNYCFSTCLGRVEGILEGDRFKFGCTELVIDAKEVHKMKDRIHISPAGVAFVNSSVRTGVLPCMLDEILETRLMVKKSMKTHKANKALHRVLDARQMGLKLIANVTYGYTSANFSGRMPCIEVGDSVVSKGRETLENAIKLVKDTKRWKAEVVYGDTDSMFVLCPGRTKEEAFVIGQEIADAVTNSNPRPVKLKLEKVYQPCILQTKKRYVGYMYETPDQTAPVFEAKGIETVRRDGCVAVAKILEKSLKILFETYDVSKVKQYVCDQLTKISSSKLNLQDLIFAREYRGMKGYKPTACVPALQLVREWLTRDPRAEPRVGERVGYCIVYGPPGVPLIQLVRDPKLVLSDPTVHINSEYYVTKVVLPPLQRCFTLLGVDTFAWYKALPRVKRTQKRLMPSSKAQKATLSQFFATVNCIICRGVSITSVCPKCEENEQLVVSKISRDITLIERKAFLLNKVCASCCGRAYDLLCDSSECPVYYRKCLSNDSQRELEFLQHALDEF